MNNTYTPPKIWKHISSNGGKFANINRPTAGSTHNKELPQGKHNFQLYSLATPNGVKATIMLEELLEAGHTAAEYDAFLINISEGDQFSSGFVDINPNSKIPALFDKETNTRIFESGSILLYLAEKFNFLLSKDLKIKTETMNWLFWQVGSGPYVGGGFGHFFSYAPEKIQYCIDRFTMETKRQLDVLDSHLKNSAHIAGDEYSIADIAIWPWYGALVMGRLYDAAEFLEVHNYKNLQRWTETINSRPAVKRGRLVNRTWGNENQQLKERHSSSDFNGIDLDN